VLDGQDALPKCRPDSGLFAAETLGPRRIVVRDDDGLRLHVPDDYPSESLRDGIVGHGRLRVLLLVPMARRRHERPYGIPASAGVRVVRKPGATNTAAAKASSKPTMVSKESLRLRSTRFTAPIASIMRTRKILRIRARP
jgi:hypothetical protein